MNISSLFTTIGFALFICFVSLARAGGDKSAKTTVITLAGGGDKHGGGYPIPIPIPVCSGGRGFGGHHHGGYQSRMGWRR